MPATIRSRASSSTFRLIPVETTRQLLRKVCEESGIEAEDEALFWIAKESTGSLRDAYTLFDQVVSFSGSAITLELIRDKLGLAGLDQINAVAEACAAGNGTRVLELADETLRKGVAVEQLIVDLTEYFRNLLFLKHGIAREALLGYSVERFSKVAREAFSASQLEQAINLLLELYRNIRYSLNQRFELELVLSRLCSLTSYLTPNEILARIRGLRSELTGGAVPGRTAEARAEKRPEPAPSASTPPRVEMVSRAQHAPSEPEDYVEADGEEESETEEDLSSPHDQPAAPKPASEAEKPPKPDGMRDQVVGALRKTKLTLATALEKATGWDLTNEALTIVFDNGYSANLVREDLATVGEAVSKIAGRKVRIAVEMKSSPKPSEQGIQHEQIELVKRVFRGEVIKGGDA